MSTCRVKVIDVRGLGPLFSDKISAINPLTSHSARNRPPSCLERNLKVAHDLRSRTVSVGILTTILPLPDPFHFSPPTAAWPSTAKTPSCSICAAAAPKYTCPRCAIRSCSLRCTQTHKQRTLCSGARDPAAYATRAQLARPAAFDRDFNFIAGVERGLEAAARDGRTRGIAGEARSGGRVVGRGARGTGANGVGIGAGRGARAPPLRRGQLPLGSSLAADRITWLRMPPGMSRARQNLTAWRRKGGGVSWTVEWVVDGGGRLADAGAEGTGRGLSQIVETMALGDAFAAWRKHVEGRKRKRRGAGDDVGVNADADEGEEKEKAAASRLFFLEVVGRSTARRKCLLPIEATRSLKDALRGATIAEFPTFYVLSEPAERLQERFEVVGEGDVRAVKADESVVADVSQDEGEIGEDGEAREQVVREPLLVLEGLG